MIDTAYQPSLYQVNTRTWLAELSCDSLDSVPEHALDEIAAHGFDWVWLMGVWQTGLIGRQIAAGIPELRQEFQRVLPDFTEGDICGSPFAVQGYHVHHDFGGDVALGRFRQRLQQRGLRLLLDFVPNHTAIDHPWATLHPEFYIQGSQNEYEANPRNYYGLQTSRGWRLLAHGRDPYFPPWSDTLQLNYRHPALRQAMIAELEHIAGMCDGVRCDMAMLLLPEVILSTWGERSLPADGSQPADDPFWSEAILRVKQRHPAFLFMAEVYWDLEHQLQEQGFDYSYDKRLYDYLRDGDVGRLRQHFTASFDFQRRLVRFLENHDEQRAARVFPEEMGPAAAVVCYLAPGLRFFHHGQLEGRRIRVPVQLCRSPVETPRESLRGFYTALLTLLRRDIFRRGAWCLLDCQPTNVDDSSWSSCIAYAWYGPQAVDEVLVVVNFSPQPARCTIQPWQEQPSASLSFAVLLASQPEIKYQYQAHSLTLELPAWGFEVLEVMKET
jgi:hypothetical protein